MHIVVQSLYMNIFVCTYNFCMFHSHWVYEYFAYNPVEVHFLADESILIPKTLSNNGISLQC